ncbi:HTH domain-containing protein [Stieleria maiorica]|uniref:HTH domain-containing protein n=1 Tax=Stieleria maiorica TaxID=2795974 RepID=UPI0011C989AA
MFIHEAAEKALREKGVPTHVSSLCRHIVDKGYYKFGAQEPENALAIQLSRRSSNVDRAIVNCCVLKNDQAATCSCMIPSLKGRPSMT